MLIKVCGLREQENVAAVAALDPQWMGFIFASSSPRYFPDAKYAADISSIPRHIKRVGVFVNENPDNVIAMKDLNELDMVQLHGDESPAICQALQQQDIAVIKAFGVDEHFDFSQIAAYEPYVKLFLFDTRGAGHGGTGRHFNWGLLKGHHFNKPFFLSGGIGPDDVQLLKAFNHPDMIGVDVNSRFELEPGIKDVSELRSFIQQIH